MKNYLLLLAAAAAETNTTNATKPWKLRNARRKNMTHWQGLKVALLYRGMHYGTYKSERHGGKFVRVNANHPTVIENHLTKIRRPLERAGAWAEPNRNAPLRRAGVEWDATMTLQRSPTMLVFHRSGAMHCPYLPARVEQQLFAELSGPDAQS